MTRLSLRAGALLAAGSLTVHELRYLVGYGGEEGVSGHGYLAWLAPLVVLSLAAAFGAWFARLGRAAGPQRPAVSWLGASAWLLATYVAQETLEALGTAEHPGLLTHGGLAVVPIALAVGGAVALLLGGARAADHAAASAVRPWSPAGATALVPSALRLPAAAPLAPRTRVLARRLAGRAPPCLS